MKNEYSIALAGNPNSGKTTVFNNLTGSRQKVGNYPGVTVEQKEGNFQHKGKTVRCFDLPGTYSLSALSVEELVARNFLINEKPDVVVDVVDASNLERNLYLTVQLLELELPLVLAFNIYDVAQAHGFEFDFEKLSKYFGAPIVCTVGSKNKGMNELVEAAIKVAVDGKQGTHSPITYGRDIDAELVTLTKLIEKENCSPDPSIPDRWLALKLLENDKEIIEEVKSVKVLTFAEQARDRLEERLGDTPEITIAERRYGFVSGACTEAVTSTVESRHTMSDKIDAIILNRALGLPIFFALMYTVFHLTFTLGEAPMGWIESLFGWMSTEIVQFWPKGSDSILKSLIIDGIIGGVGGVIVFLPNIVLLFTAITFLETTGYMSRAAFLLDKIMHKIGLNGKSFIPMLTGFGCSVPAIMATRTLNNQRDRLATMFVIPLMSCSARLPIYALIIPAFFPSGLRGSIMFLIYLIGIVLAISLAKLLRSSVLKSKNDPFVMELPPYRMPTLKSILIHTFERSWLYLKKAGTVILGISIILWAMIAFPKKDNYDRDYKAELAQVTKAYLAETRKITEELFKADAPNPILELLDAELALEKKLEVYHESQPAYAKLREEFDQTIDRLKTSDGGEHLAQFIKLRKAIPQQYAEFETIVQEKGFEKDSADYLMCEQARDLALNKFRHENLAVYDVTVDFINKTLADFENKRKELDRSQQSEDLTYSIAGRIGKTVEPIFKPIGFDWRIDTALIGAFAAKEVFVAQLGIVFSLGEVDEDSDDLRDQLRENYNPLVAFSIMLFCLISAPCMATIAVTKRESNSWSWALLQLGGLTVLAYVICLIVYQAGLALQIGTT